MVFKRLMGCNVEDLIRWLPEALGSYYEHSMLDIDGLLYRDTPKPLIRLIGKTKPDHQVSLLRIPQLEINIEISDLVHDDIKTIIHRFDLYTRRGGG
ncbi:MAG: hypothetical protein EBY19_02750 [Burkholderiaceae bacterium]|nr:hypothetical protein [Burkholderiaceae bacterium]NDG90667.1 hypothetical protein [Burkholderiaceae bacterium]